MTDSGEGTVTYSGSGPWGDSTVAWNVTRRWPDLTTSPFEGPARVLATLAHPNRLRIVAELVGEDRIRELPFEEREERRLPDLAHLAVPGRQGFDGGLRISDILVW